ncbi:GH92 family glycosyl hydrolase [Arachidicoccus ginsenosidivorans]|nr:GH92 family glycosyl hydrolase [Arachidicoccus ginsenosidivorans]
MKKWTLMFGVWLLGLTIAWAQQSPKKIWQVGTMDHSANEFALAPNGFKNFVASDFGYEDKFFVVNRSVLDKDFPYVLPGPADTWGGTNPATGWRTNELNILFRLQQVNPSGQYVLVIDLADYAKKFLPVIKLSINGVDTTFQIGAIAGAIKKQKKTGKNEPFVDSMSLKGNKQDRTPTEIRIPIAGRLLRSGGNSICMTIIDGSWIMFDDMALLGDNKTSLQISTDAYIGHVRSADYEFISGGQRSQPLLIEAKYLSGSPVIKVLLDGDKIFSAHIDSTSYDFECPMPAVKHSQKSRYTILIDNKAIETGTVKRTPQKLQTPADYVDTRIGTAHSRWMIAPGPWMPFSMVKISPDNQNGGRMAGYEPHFETIGTFSHVHEWTLGGLGIFATNGPLKTKIGDEQDPDSGYRSRINKRTEEAPIGYYKADLLDYGIKAELTATTRCSFERFSFPKDRAGARILLDFMIPTETRYKLKQIKWHKVSDYRIEGFAHQLAAHVWSRDADQDYTLHFVLEFDQPIEKLGYWVADSVHYANQLDVEDATTSGLFATFNVKHNAVVKVRLGMSMVSIANAAENLRREIEQPFGWDFEAVRAHQVATWNKLLGRVNVTTYNRDDKIRFYNSLYRSICSRNIFSDANGQWRGTDGQVQQLTDADDVVMGCDAFWNTFWNLNQVWNLITPDWSKRWMHSQLAMYDAYGWLAKGPAGLNYIPVMVAEHEIPLLVSAYQMGIRSVDADKLLQAVVKMQSTPARKLYNGFVGNRDLTSYLKYHYVPTDKGSFSNTMEYSFDDWNVAELAKTLGKPAIEHAFSDRATWWNNAIDDSGYCHMRSSSGEWSKDFDPMLSGAGREYVEGNGWQMSYFVPQNPEALISKVGRKPFINRLLWGFEKSEPWRYNGPNKAYWSCPVNQGNEQTMHLPYLFNFAGAPWLTQKWTRSILSRYYGKGMSNAYLGDEDQGQMSGWFVMTAMGLFQTDGGGSAHPQYEIGSPLFPKIEIDLGGRFGRGRKFVIIAKNASYDNKYVQKAKLNGHPLNSFHFDASDVLKGGTLELEMGPLPNKNWGIAK